LLERLELLNIRGNNTDIFSFIGDIVIPLGCMEKFPLKKFSAANVWGVGVCQHAAGINNEASDIPLT
jgi:hypothetical protein